MNAAIDMRRLEIQDELQLLRDRLHVAHEQRDKWRRNQAERQFWDQRVADLSLEISIVQSRLKVVAMHGDGGPDEQRRLEAREDWQREFDSYE